MNVDKSDDQSYTSMQERMAEVLREHVGTWGPRVCEHGPWEECDEESCTYDDTRVDHDAVLSEFILIGCFVRMEDGTASIVQVTPPRQLWHHTLGLVEEWREG